ncbi:MAG: EVE domain-containing protein [Thermoflexibacter sp.]|jgi:predicted RNA-binding protein with PUA-like domain|nr:EVE domain-containing protein [Thermoflexibacter sp.]
MNYWLIKSEPNTYSWDDFVKEKKTLWNGVRNFQARNNLRAMREGDFVFFYHSVHNPSVVGIAKVVKEAYQDPTTEDPNWVVVDLEPYQPLKNAVSLQKIKETPDLQNIALIRQSRLSVMPLKQEEFDLILALAE